MGDTLNVAALHDSGLPRVTVGIRGNRFRFDKAEVDRVDLLDPATSDLLRFRALFEFSDATLVEEHITQIEDILGHLYEMVTTDDFWAAITDDDGALIVDDESEYPIGDNWSVVGPLNDLRNRVTDLETTVSDLVGYTYDLGSTILKHEERLYALEQAMAVEIQRLNRLSGVVDSGFNHVFLVDDSG